MPLSALTLRTEVGANTADTLRLIERAQALR